MEKSHVHNSPAVFLQHSFAGAWDEAFLWVLRCSGVALVHTPLCFTVRCCTLPKYHTKQGGSLPRNCPQALQRYRATASEADSMSIAVAVLSGFFASFIALLMASALFRLRAISGKRRTARATISAIVCSRR